MFRKATGSIVGWVAQGVLNLEKGISALDEKTWPGYRDEQLQRFRKAIPKGSWWTEQLKTCKNIDRAWEILDIEFADKRKLMDELLAEIDNYGTVKGDSKSLGRFATSVLVFVSDMEDNGCLV